MTCDKCGGQPEHFYKMIEPRAFGPPEASIPYKFCSLECLIEWAAEQGRETPFAVIERPGDP